MAATRGSAMLASPTYLAINMGAVLGPMTTGFVQNEWGFHWGFGLAAVGMTAALVQYVFSMRKLPDRTNAVRRPVGRAKLIAILLAGAVLGSIVATLIVSGVVKPEQLASITTVLILIAAAWYFVMMLSSKNVTRDEKTRVAAYLPLFLAAGCTSGCSSSSSLRSRSSSPNASTCPSGIGVCLFHGSP